MGTRRPYGHGRRFAKQYGHVSRRRARRDQAVRGHAPDAQTSGGPAVEAGTRAPPAGSSPGARSGYAEGVGAQTPAAVPSSTCLR